MQMFMYRVNCRVSPMRGRTFRKKESSETVILEGLLRQRKIDRLDYFAQLIAVGGEMVGAVTVQ